MSSRHGLVYLHWQERERGSLREEGEGGSQTIVVVSRFGVSAEEGERERANERANADGHRRHIGCHVASSACVQERERGREKEKGDAGRGERGKGSGGEEQRERGRRPSASDPSDHRVGCHVAS